ncbi:MAG: zinc metalloprotease, partial [Planctomycetota bacterium]
MEAIRFKYLCIAVMLLITTGVVSAQEIDVRLSVKYILDGSGNRPQGAYSTNQAIQNIINQSNVTLERWGRGYQYVITEFRDVSGAAQFFDLSEDGTDTEYYALEDTAEANPGQYFWRTTATNIFIVNTYKGGCGSAAAIPSAPHDAGYELVVICVNTGLDLTIPHELGHHNNLGHTFDSDDGVDDTREDPSPFQCSAPFNCVIGGSSECCCDAKIIFLNAASAQGGWTQQEYDDIRWNLMSYYGAGDCSPAFSFANVRLTEGQLDRWTDATRGYHFGEVSGFTY